MFGCVAYAHIPKENQKKLDKKGEKCIFIGYSHETKGYRLYKPESKELIISRDVIFDEAVEWMVKKKNLKLAKEILSQEIQVRKTEQTNQQTHHLRVQAHLEVQDHPQAQETKHHVQLFNIKKLEDQHEIDNRHHGYKITIVTKQ